MALNIYKNIKEINFAFFWGVWKFYNLQKLWIAQFVWV